MADILQRTIKLKEVQNFFFEKINEFDEVIKCNINLREYEEAQQNCEINKQLIDVWGKIFEIIEKSKGRKNGKRTKN